MPALFDNRCQAPVAHMKSVLAIAAALSALSSETCFSESEASFHRRNNPLWRRNARDISGKFF